MNYYLDTEFHEYETKHLVGKSHPTIELISIGIVAEDGREYYAISKDFDIKAAWFDNEWLRENVLKSIHKELYSKVGTYDKYHHAGLFPPFSYKSMKTLLKRYGKSKEQIAEEVKEFVYKGHTKEKEVIDKPGVGNKALEIILNPINNFYAYYADYDWVVFCWLFGRMIDLPKGFPMYCNDLKQILEAKQDNEHNALADAKWNKRLHEFLKKIE